MSKIAARLYLAYLYVGMAWSHRKRLLRTLMAVNYLNVEIDKLHPLRVTELHDSHHRIYHGLTLIAYAHNAGRLEFAYAWKKARECQEKGHLHCE